MLYSIIFTYYLLLLTVGINSPEGRTYYYYYYYYYYYHGFIIITIIATWQHQTGMSGM